MLACWLWMLACSPGLIRYPGGWDRLRTALYAVQAHPTDPSARAALVLLANSELACEPYGSDDPADRERAQVDFLAALTRENARVVLLWLYRHEASPWSGTYPVTEDAELQVVDLRERAAGAAYLGVNEAVVEDEDGIARYYQPGDEIGDVVAYEDVGGPGEVVLRSEGRPLAGTFELDAVDVSGRFRADPCTSGAAILELVQMTGDVLPSDTGGDTGEPQADDTR